MCGEEVSRISASVRQPSQDTTAKPFPYHLGLFDVHNHVAERPYTIEGFKTAKTRSQAIMATRSQDQSIVSSLASAYPLSSPTDFVDEDKRTVIPGFGQHPWFSHLLYDDLTTANPSDLITSDDDNEERVKTAHYTAVLNPPPTDPDFLADLPTPLPLSHFIQQLKEHISQHPYAIVGEIGLDKPFRLPQQWDHAAKAHRDLQRTEGGREQRPLSQHKISMDHQKTVLKAQLQVAAQFCRPVSVHGVQVHGVLYEILTSLWKGYEKSKRAERKAKSSKVSPASETSNVVLSKGDKVELPYPPRICLHSFSGKAEAVQQYLHPTIPTEIYFSFSATNNMRDEASKKKMEEAVRMVPGDKVLVESDLHTVGERMDGELEEVYRMICEVKAWELEDGVKRIRENYSKFVFGE